MEREEGRRGKRKSWGEEKGRGGEEKEEEGGIKNRGMKEKVGWKRKEEGVEGGISLVPRPRTWEEGKVAWYPLFAHARKTP